MIIQAVPCHGPFALALQQAEMRKAAEARRSAGARRRSRSPRGNLQPQFCPCGPPVSAAGPFTTPKEYFPLGVFFFKKKFSVLRSNLDDKQPIEFLEPVCVNGVKAGIKRSMRNEIWCPSLNFGMMSYI